MTNEIFYKVLGQAVRFVLRLAAGLFAYFGVSNDDQTTFVEVSVGIITPLLLVAIAEGWSLLQKRYSGILFEAALLAKPSDPVAQVQKDAAATTSAPVAF